MNSKHMHSICKIIFFGIAVYLVVTNLFTSSVTEGHENIDNNEDNKQSDDVSGNDVSGNHEQTQENVQSKKPQLSYVDISNRTGLPMRHMSGGVKYMPKNVMRVPDVVSGDVTSSSIAPNSEVLSNTIFHNGQYQSINSLETQPMLQTTPKYAY